MKKVEIVPLEVIVRNVAAGSFSKRLGIEEGRKLLAPTLEFSYKDDDLGDPLINDYYFSRGVFSCLAEESEDIFLSKDNYHEPDFDYDDYYRLRKEGEHVE